MPAKSPGPGTVARSSNSPAKINPNGKTQTDGAIAPALNEATGLAKNITSGPGRDSVTQRGGVRVNSASNLRGVAGGQHAGGNSDTTGKPKIPAALKPQGKGAK